MVLRRSLRFIVLLVFVLNKQYPLKGVILRFKGFFCFYDKLVILRIKSRCERIFVRLGGSY